MHPVAITGIGIVSCLGTGTSKVSRALREGRSGIRLDPRRTEIGFRSALTGVIDDFEPPRLDRKKRKTMTDFDLQAYAAALEAIEMAGWDENLLRHEMTGLIIGNDSACQANLRQVEITLREKSTLPIGSGLVFQALNSTVTMNLNVLLGTRGASWTIAGACASGGHAIGQSADLIALGRQDRILCGGVQEVNWESVASFDATNAFSIRQEEPEAASCPFDARRDGLIPSGGAAIVALERLDLAQARNASILGIVRSYAFSSDGYSLASPSGEGIFRCMKDCLARAKSAVDRIDYVCAHATSTPVGDAAEAEAIAQVFGAGENRGPWVSSVKSMTGHEMWMAGAGQVVYSVLMGRDGFIAPNRNFVRQEEDVPRLRIAAETVDQKPEMILCNSAGFGGTNSCLLLEI
ncbi:beta-ketoacyl-[acyl-carrier-protein] synthase family protein [bacterium]|nr:beta-ketoacyl-[acyl-carrier-protein] synthase family protein [bacterium]